MRAGSPPRFAPTELERCASGLLEAVGVGPGDAWWTAHLLVASDLADHASHGLMRVPGYLAAIERGETNPRAVPRVARDEGATATVDGELGLGQVVARAATAEAVARARLHGISCVAVRRCCHVGRLAHFAGLIADEGQIGIVVANDAGTGQVVAPPGVDRRPPLDEPARDRRAAIDRAALRARHVDERRVARQGADPSRARRAGARRLGGRRRAAGARRLQGVRAGARRRDPRRRPDGAQATRCGPGRERRRRRAGRDRDRDRRGEVPPARRSRAGHRRARRVRAVGSAPARRNADRAAGRARTRGEPAQPGGRGGR